MISWYFCIIITESLLFSIFLAILSGSIITLLLQTQIYIDIVYIFMSKNLIQGDSLLSNISNISVKINHNRSDGSGFFNNYIRDHQNDKEIHINDLDDQESFHHGSLLDKIYSKQKQHIHLQEPEQTWVSGKEPPGLSEEQNSSSEIIQQSVEMLNEQKKCKSNQPNSSSLKDEPIEEDSQQKKQRLLLQKRLKNETKNIPKNYGKAIISFIQKYQDKVRYITEQNGVTFQDFLQQLKQKKKTINTIADLRNIWIGYKYAKCMRLLSNLFLRKYALHYIFNSRICNYTSHIKYRYRLCEAIRQPYAFKHIKDY